jgi:hypothetical protein
MVFPVPIKSKPFLTWTILLAHDLALYRSGVWNLTSHLLNLQPRTNQVEAAGRAEGDNAIHR